MIDSRSLSLHKRTCTVVLTTRYKKGIEGVPKKTHWFLLVYFFLIHFFQASINRKQVIPHVDFLSSTYDFTANMTTAQPSVKWGQKKDHILLTIAVQDIEKPEINIEPAKLHFKGQQTKGLNYDTTLEFFEEIDPQASKYRKTSQNHWEFMLKKKDPSKAMWKRLIKSPAKFQWITVDWNHFTADGDDDDDLDLPDGKNWGDLDGMFKQMGGGLGGASPTDMNDLEDEEIDSDDEPMPDLEEVPKADDQKTKSTQEAK